MTPFKKERGAMHRLLALARPLSMLAPLMAGLGCSDYQVISQGHVDVFYQDVAASVDILLVVDNSPSMTEEQQKLGETFQTFIQYFTGGQVDYHIGVVSTDVSDSTTAGVLNGGYISIDDESAEDDFARAVSVGSDGDGMEKGLLAGLMALTEPLASDENAGFIRESADLSVIFVADEDDYSPGSVYDYINSYRNVKLYHSRDALKISAVVGNVPEGCAGDGVDAAPGYRYAEAADSNFGIVESICADNFSDVAERLGITASGLMTTFELSAHPDPDSLVVTVDDEEIERDVDIGWEYYEDDNTIVFALTAIPPSGSVIRATYDTYSTEAAVIE